MKYLVISATLLIIGPLLYLFIKAALKNNGKYKQKSILTPNELEFFWRLSRALPEVFIFPQVSMTAIIDPTAQQGTKAFMSAFGRISQKRVDYALYDVKLQLICIVELDDKTHQADKDQERDYLLKSAGIRTIRWNSKKKPDFNEIQKQVFQLEDIK